MVAPLHSSSSTLSLTLFGGFSARMGDAEVVLPTRKARALLAYVAVSAGRPEPREKLCALFWKDTRREQAQQSLRQTLFSLRRALGDGGSGVLVTDARSVALEASAVRVDAHELAELASRRSRDALEQVARLYKGPLLDGMTIDELGFDEWLVGERRRFVELTVAALAHLADLQSADGAGEEALQTRLQLARLDPRAEANQRAILTLYAEQGRRAAALSHYRELAAGVPRGARLEPETVALYDALAAPAASSGSFGKDASSSLVAREAELAALVRGLEDGWAGSGRVAVLTGDAGAGKTRLLDELEAHAGRRGGRVLRGRAFESEQILPFAMWVDALREGGVLSDDSLLQRLSLVERTELARLTPRGDTAPAGTPNGPALRFFQAVTALLAALSARAPVALFFDDLQWADEMSLRLLAYVARHVSPSRLFLAATARREELARAPFLPTLLREFTRESRSLDVDVHPLSEADTAALVRLLGSDGQGGDAPVDPRLSARIWKVSDGNPFVIVEMMRALAGGAPLGDVERLPVPDRVRELVTAHTERLEPTDRGLTEIAAVIGREFDLRLLAAASGETDVNAAASIERLVRAFVLKDSGGAFFFTHDRIREVVYAGLLPVRRAVLHGAVAAAIGRVRARDLDAVCDQLAHHHGRAGDARAAAGYLIRFAKNAARAFGLEEALSALAEATALLEKLPPGERPRYAVEIAVRKANCLAYLGRFAEIEPCLTQHEADLAGLDLPSLTGQYHFWMGFNHSLSGNRARAQEHILTSLHLAERANDAWTAQRAHGLMAFECAAAGDFAAGIRHGLESTSNPAIAEPEDLALAWMNLGINYVLVGRHHDGLAAFARSRDIAETGGVARVCSFVTGYTGYALAQIGDVAEGIATCKRAVEMAPDPVSIMSAYTCLASAQAEGGEPAAALAILPNVVAMCRQFGMKSTEGIALGTLAEAHLALGDFSSTFDQVDEALAISRESGNPRIVGKALRLRAEAAISTGDLHLAAASLSESEALLRESGALFDLGFTLCTCGELANARGDAAGARPYFDEAVALYERLSLPGPASRVRARRGGA